MNQDSIKLIGFKDVSRKDSYIAHLNQVEGLKDMFNGNFNLWSNFDSWESIGAQQWIFVRALDVYKGKKIDIKCDCCEYNHSISNNFENITREKCYGKKTAYMIKKIVEEIYLAKTKRESDGTYSV